MKNIFKNDYNINKLFKINLENFVLNVTERYRGHYCENNYEIFSTELFLNLLKEDSIVVDVGANYGYYSLLASTKNKKGKTYAIEPVIENFEVLNRNILENSFFQVISYNLAISDKSGEKEFCISEASDSSGFHGNPNAKIIKKIKIKTESLDNLFRGKRIDIIKIDAEGHEPYVIDGAREVIKGNPKIKLFIEFNPKCLKISGIDPNYFIKNLVFLNLDIFIIKETERMIYKVNPNDFSWIDFLEEKEYCNIICMKKDFFNFISFFSHSAHLGGSERSLLELVKDLKSKEILCHVFLPENGPLEDELKKIAVSYEVVDYRWWTLQENEDKRDVAKGINEQSMSLIERVAKLNPNLIYTNTSVVNVGAIIAKELGIPHVWHVREYGEKDHGLKFVLDEKERARYISNNSDFVFFNSGAVRDYYSKLADFKSNAIVYNSVSVDNFNQDLERGEVFKKDNFFHVSIIGTVSPGKGQKDAVMAMKKLINKGQKIELAIIGNVSDIAYLSEIEEVIKKEGLEDNIHIYNFIRNVFPIIKKSDLILVCSKNEAFGRVTVEGMLAKKTVIGTNSGGTPEIIEDGVNGFLYEPGDYDQLAEKIEWLIKNPKEAKKMGENGYKIVSDKFSKNNYSGKILGFLKEIISNNLTRDIFREEGANLVLSLLKEIKSKNQEVDIKNGENACLKEENEKIKEENEKIREEVLIIKNSKFWKLRSFYLKVKHYFIFIFLNPRKFLKKQFKEIK